MTLVAGVDSSTQSCKLEVRDADTGELVRSGQRPHPPTVPPRSEQDPHVWWDALSSLIEEHGRDVAAISRRRPAARHGRARRRRRGAATGQALERHRVGTRGRRTRRTLGPAALGRCHRHRARRLDHHHQARMAARARARALRPRGARPPPARLADTAVDRRGLHRPRRRLGYRVLVAGLEAYVPDAARPRRPRPHGRPDRARTRRARRAHTRGMVVAAGTGDNMGAALGLGLAEGDVAISLGTSGTVFAVSGHPTNDASGAVAGFADATGRLPAPGVHAQRDQGDRRDRAPARTRRATSSTSWPPDRAPGAGGVVLLPYFDGERTPNLPDATGTVAGLRSDTAPAHLAARRVRGRGVRICSRHWTRWRVRGCRPTGVACSSSAAVPGRRSIRSSSPTSLQRPVEVPVAGRVRGQRRVRPGCGRAQRARRRRGQPRLGTRERASSNLTPTSTRPPCAAPTPTSVSAPIPSQELTS